MKNFQSFCLSLHTAWIPGMDNHTICQLFNRLSSAMRVLTAFVRNKLAIGCGCLLATLFIDPGVNFSVIVMLLFYYRLEVYFEVSEYNDS
jgi:Na+/H+-dicarboxylate symporter